MITKAKCPKCGGYLKRTERTYYCSNRRWGCKFSPWIYYGGRRLLTVKLINEMHKKDYVECYHKKKNGKMMHLRLMFREDRLDIDCEILN